MCDSTTCRECGPSNRSRSGGGRKYKPGNIVRFKGSPRTSAAPGSVAIVYGYSPVQGARGPGEPVEYLQVFWLSNTAGAQSNGSYIEDEFDLMYEDPTRYRPDIKPEDRGLSLPGSFGAGEAVKRISQAISAARAAGIEVTCEVLEEEVVKKRRVL